MKKSVLSTILTVVLVIFATCLRAVALETDALPTVVDSINVNNVVDSTSNTLTSTVLGGAGAVGQNDMTGGLGSNSTWNINASNHSQTFLGRFIDGKLTEINGKINTGCAAGNCGYGNTLKVILTNPYGIYFGSGSQVNANSFTVSGFDAVGAKNIKDMSASELAEYKASLTSKFGPDVNITFEGGNATNGGTVTLNNSTWNIDKSAAIVAKDINMYRGSKISTNLDYNYGNPRSQNFSNVKLITSDGVTFKYAANGYNRNEGVVVKNPKSNVDYKITIGDKNSSNATDATISSGSVQVINAGTSNGSKLAINKAAIKGYKLVNNAYGDIYLVGNDVEINKSLLGTYNTSEGSLNTNDKQGGNIVISANRGLSITDSELLTASSTNPTDAGNIVLDVANAGNLSVSGSTLDAKGSITAKANNGNLTVDNSSLTAVNNTLRASNNLVFNKAKIKATEKNSITAGKNVDGDCSEVTAKDNDIIAEGESLTIKNSAIKATGDNKITAAKNLKTSNVRINGNNNTIKSTKKGVMEFVNTEIIAANKNDINSKEGDLTFKFDSEVQAACVGNGCIDPVTEGVIQGKENSVTTEIGDIYISGANITANDRNVISATNDSVSLKDTKVTSGGNNEVFAGGDVDTDCVELDAKDNIVQATQGSARMKNTTVKASNNNSITAANDVKTSNVKVTGKNNTVTSRYKNVDFVNTQIVASNKNTITSKKGNVSFKYDAEANATCTGAGCNGPVESSVTGKENDITADNGSVSIKDTKVTAEDGDNNIVAKDDVDTDCAELDAQNNNVVAQNGKVTMKNSKVTAKNNNVITANLDVKTTNVIVNGKNNTITSQTKNVDLLNTQLVAAQGKNTVTAKKGNVTFKYDENENATCTGVGCNGPVDSSVTGDSNDIIAEEGSIDLEDVVITAEEGDNNLVAADDVSTKCVELDAKKGNNVVTAQNGKITMSNTKATAKQDNLITANQDIKTTNVILKAGNDNRVQSVNGNINHVNTKYSAKHKNLVVANNGKVSFRYDPNENATCTGAGCDGPIDSAIEGPDNEIIGEEAEVDVTIIPDDPENPEDTTTVITADEVTTGARVIYDSLYDQIGRIEGIGQLDTNGTKVKINSTGNVNLVLANTNNPKAGLEINAPKVEIKTREAEAGNPNGLSISRIVADELYLSKDEKFIAGEVTITDPEKAIDSFYSGNPESLMTQEGFDAQLPGRAYIEVREGFNFDYEPSPVAVGGMYQGSFNEIRDAEGNIIGYGKHYITLDDSSTEGQFLLTYSKPFACDPEPPVIPDGPIFDNGYIADQTAWTRIPLQADIIGQVGNIANGTTDLSSGMIAAAAAIDVEDIEE